MKKFILLCPIILLGCFLAWPGLAVDKVTGVKVSKIKSNAAKVSWTADSDAASYVVKVRKKKNKKLVDTEKPTTNSVWVQLPKKKKYYRVKVRAKDSYGNLGPWSKAKLFKSKSWRYYHNNNYGFGMKFPKTWEGLKVKKTSGTDGVYINFKLYSSAMSQYYTMFSILVYTHEQWEDTFWSDKLGENDDYVFEWMHAQDCATDLCARAVETQDIIDTFKAHN